MAKKVKYPGRLGEKRKYTFWGKFSHLGSHLLPEAKVLSEVPEEFREECKEFIEQKTEEDFELLFELCDFYSIDRQSLGAFMILALALARDHVPGFQYEDKQRGRKTKWTHEEKDRLVRLDAAIQREKPDLNKKERMKFASELFKERLGRRELSDSLYQRLMDAQKKTK